MALNRSYRNLVAVSGISLCRAAAPVGSTSECHIGSYRLTNGTTVDIAESDGGTLRWLTFSGERGQLHPQANGTWASTYGWTNRPDGKTVSFSGYSAGEIRFGNEKGNRVEFDVSDTNFQSNGVKLVGRLVLPQGTRKVPVVVLVHGSEHDSALETYALQRMLPA